MTKRGAGSVSSGSRGWPLLLHRAALRGPSHSLVALLLAQAGELTSQPPQLHGLHGGELLEGRGVIGKTLGENLEGAEVYNEKVIPPLDEPIAKAGGTFVLRGNLAPDGCVIKPTAAEPRLLAHRGIDVTE